MSAPFVRCANDIIEYIRNSKNASTYKFRCDSERLIDFAQLRLALADMEGWLPEHCELLVRCDPPWVSVVDEFTRERYDWISVECN